MAEEYKPGIKYGPNNRAQVDWDRYQAGTGSQLDYSQGGIQGNMAKDSGWWNPFDMDLKYDENGKPFFEETFGGDRQYIDEQYFQDDPESGSVGKETTRKEVFNAKQALKKASKFKVDPNEMSDWAKIGYMSAPHIGKIPGAIGKGVGAVVGGAGNLIKKGAGAIIGGPGKAYDALTEAWTNHTNRDENNQPMTKAAVGAGNKVFDNMSDEDQRAYNTAFGLPNSMPVAGPPSVVSQTPTQQPNLNSQGVPIAGPGTNVIAGPPQGAYSPLLNKKNGQVGGPFVFGGQQTVGFPYQNAGQPSKMSMLQKALQFLKSEPT